MISIAAGFSALVLAFGLMVAGLARAKMDEAGENGETD